MVKKPLTFSFDSHGPVTAADVIAAIHDLLGPAAPLKEWTVSRISMQSPLQVSAFHPKVIKQVAAFAKTMNNVAAGKKPRKNLVGVQAALLTGVIAITSGVFATVKIEGPGIPKAIITKETAQKASVYIEPDSSLPASVIIVREQAGSLRGYLEQITAKQGSKAHFIIRDRLTDRPVNCIIPAEAEHLYNTAHANLRKRVTVAGRMKLSPAGEPTSIEAEQIEPIKEYIIPFDKWPRVDLAGGVDPVKHVRRLRDGA